MLLILIECIGCTLAWGCWKVTLELLSREGYLSRWGEVDKGNLWAPLGWLWSTAEKQIWTVSFNAFSWDSCDMKQDYTQEDYSGDFIYRMFSSVQPSIHQLWGISCQARFKPHLYSIYVVVVHTIGCLQDKGFAIYLHDTHIILHTFKRLQTTVSSSML